MSSPTLTDDLAVEAGAPLGPELDDEVLVDLPEAVVWEDADDDDVADDVDPCVAVATDLEVSDAAGWLLLLLLVLEALGAAFEEADDGLALGLLLWALGCDGVGAGPSVLGGCFSSGSVWV